MHEGNLGTGPSDETKDFKYKTEYKFGHFLKKVIR